MKTAGFIFAFLMMLCGIAQSQVTATFSRKIAEGMSGTPLGKYSIMASDQPVMLAGEKVECYRITYENSPREVFIYLDKEWDCMNYLVVSENVSVMYKCNGNYFGVSSIPDKYSKDGLSTDLNEVDRLNFLHQKIIALGRNDEKEAARLIACYYPVLIK